MMGRSRFVLEHWQLAGSRLLAPEVSPPTYPIHTYAVCIAGACVVLSLALSTFLIMDHLTSYKDPEEQKWIIGVIFMVPVYAVASFVSLWQPQLSIACNILGNSYEAYALYSFGCYLIACLGGEDKVLELFEREGKAGPRTPLLEDKSDPKKIERRAVVEHPTPLNWCIKPWELGQDFYTAAKFGIVQYMILKTLCAILALILKAAGWYNEGELQYNDGYPYITIVLNFSQTWALYCLIQFYAQTHEELKSINPLAKFICFKSIVFATWWQGVMISLIFSSSLGNSVDLGPDELSGGEFQTFLQDFLICCEMGIAAVAHTYIFPATPYKMIGLERRRGNVSVLFDYASIDSPLDPEEVRESKKPVVMKYTDPSVRDTTSVRKSVGDIILVGGGHVVQDMKMTVHQAVEPMEKHMSKFNETFHQLPWGKQRREKYKSMTKDDLFVGTSSSPGQPVKGIDDPLIAGSISDSGVVRKKAMAYGSEAESSGESTDQGLGGFKTGGRRWTIKR